MGVRSCAIETAAVRAADEPQRRDAAIVTQYAVVTCLRVVSQSWRTLPTSGARTTTRHRGDARNSFSGEGE